MALVKTGDNARANGAKYLAGIVIEILLKGRLLKYHPSVAATRPDDLSPEDSDRWRLVWRSHDLAEILDHLPRLRVGVLERGRQAGLPYFDWLSGICGRWSIHARYSSQTSTIADAKEMIARVRALKELIK